MDGMSNIYHLEHESVLARRPVIWNAQ